MDLLDDLGVLGRGCYRCCWVGVDLEWSGVSLSLWVLE